MPCLDEPCFKANFKVSVKVSHPEHQAISNTPVEYHDKQSNTYFFERTPFMSCYLLCIIVGKFQSIEKKSPKN